MAKKKKKTHEGSLVGSTVLGVVTALFGVMLGIFSLSVEEVSEVRDMPAPEKIDPNAVYYVMGRDGPSSYKGMERAFLERRPGAIRLTEQDLNRWAADTFKFAKAKPGEDENVGMINLRPTAPQFRIADGVMQIGMNVDLEAFGHNYKIRYQSRGVFVQTAEGYAFQPFISYMGSAQLPPVGVAPFLGDSLYSVFKTTEQFPALHEAWISLTTVALDDTSLILVRQ